MPSVLPENSFPDLRASSLAPKEPYHLPGYAGYKPQYKYQCNETFGATTHRLITSEDIRKSHKTVLRPIDPPRSRTCPLAFHDVPKLEGDDYDLQEILSRRRPKWGDHLFRPNMKSGYTGCVPKAHLSSYHAKNFPEISNTALKDFSEDQTNQQEKLRSMFWTMELQEADNLTSFQREAVSTSVKLPLRKVRASVPPYKSPRPFKHEESPYFLPEDHPGKNFKSGFAGHVPFYKDIGGHSFPIVSNNALKEFSRERARVLSTANKQLDPKALTKPRPPKKGFSFSSQATRNKVFLVDSGLIPRYAGHVPGEKFRIGQTFGDSTENPLKLKILPPVPTMKS